MRIDNDQPSNPLKIAHVARQQRQAVRERSGGNNGIWEFDAVLLAQGYRLLNYGLIERQHHNAVYQRLHKRLFIGWLGLGQ